MENPLNTPSYALIEGSLCLLNRRGGVVRRHRPLGTVIEEFLVDGPRIFVREAGEGFLLGIPNLYCLDEQLRQLWIAELPPEGGHYTGVPSLAEGRLLCPAASCSVSIDPGSGRLA